MFSLSIGVLGEELQIMFLRVVGEVCWCAFLIWNQRIRVRKGQGGWSKIKTIQEGSGSDGRLLSLSCLPAVRVESALEPCLSCVWNDLFLVACQRHRQWSVGYWRFCSYPELRLLLRCALGKRRSRQRGQRNSEHI